MTLCVKTHERGVTLTELLVASAMVLVVVIGIERTDIARFFIGEEIRKHTVAGSPEQHAAAVAALHFSKRVEEADRINLISNGIPPASGNVQLRIPICAAVPVEPACLDDPASYRWDQYVLNGNELRYYADTATGSGCDNLRVLARQVESFTVAFMDTAPAPAPPGGEPFPAPPSPADNNLVEVAILWNNGAVPTPLTHEFRSEVTARGLAYSDVNTDCAGACDSGTGLALGAVPGPPGLCP